MVIMCVQASEGCLSKGGSDTDGAGLAG